MSITAEWCECVEAATDDELRNSPFFRLAWTCGTPLGVVATKRSVTCLLRIGKANGHEDEDEYRGMVEALRRAEKEDA
jgi:hypothetical protein